MRRLSLSESLILNDEGIPTLLEDWSRGGDLLFDFEMSLKGDLEAVSLIGEYLVSLGGRVDRGPALR